MNESRTKPFDDWVLYITNHFTHPVFEAQSASPRYHLARKLAEKGQKLLVYCPIGRHVGNPLRDFVTNLIPRRMVRGNIVYLFPPVVVSPASVTTPLTLVMGTLFILAFLTFTRIKIAAQYSTTMLVSSVGAVVRIRTKTPLVSNYGDPDFARERGLARRAFGFCENLVISRGNAYAIVYVDEVIGEYVKSRFGVKRALFLPNGGYEIGFARPAANDPEIEDLRKQLGLEGKRVVIYAGQISRAYRMDILVPAARKILERVPNAVFVLIGEGSALPLIAKEVKSIGIAESFRILGPVPYEKISPYLAVSDIGLQLLSDMCMGTKVMMYMANHLSVISTGAWYNRYGEFLRNGENSILIPPDSAFLSSRAIELLNNPLERRHLAEAGWTSISPYTWDKHAEETLSLLREARDESLGR